MRQCWIKGDKAYFNEPANMGKVDHFVSYKDYKTALLVIEGKNELLAAYRTGSQPKESTWKKLKNEELISKG